MHSRSSSNDKLSLQQQHDYVNFSYNNQAVQIPSALLKQHNREPVLHSTATTNAYDDDMVVGNLQILDQDADVDDYGLPTQHTTQQPNTANSNRHEDIDNMILNDPLDATYNYASHDILPSSTNRSNIPSQLQPRSSIIGFNPAHTHSNGPTPASRIQSLSDLSSHMHAHSHTAHAHTHDTLTNTTRTANILGSTAFPRSPLITASSATWAMPPLDMPLSAHTHTHNTASAVSAQTNNNNAQPTTQPVGVASISASLPTSPYLNNANSGAARHSFSSFSLSAHTSASMLATHSHLRDNNNRQTEYGIMGDNQHNSTQEYEESVDMLKDNMDNLMIDNDSTMPNSDSVSMVSYHSKRASEDSVPGDHGDIDTDSPYIPSASPAINIMNSKLTHNVNRTQQYTGSNSQSPQASSAGSPYNSQSTSLPNGTHAHYTLFCVSVVSLDMCVYTYTYCSSMV